MTAQTPSLTFRHNATDRALDASSAQVIVAGYTGANSKAVQHHIAELQAIGVPPPETVPAVYPMPARLATHHQVIDVAGQHTSGEVEPVILRLGGQLFLTVGSDHTDRMLERESIARSKESCPKPISPRVVPFPSDVDPASIRLRCTVDSVSYQDGTLAALLPMTDIMATVADSSSVEGDDLVILGGTVPLLTGSFLYGEHWAVSLEIPGTALIEHEYTVRRTRT